MKKKNYFWSLLAMMMAVTLSVGLSSCSSDDDEESGNEVIGTWVYVNSSNGSTDTLVFNPDNTGIWTWVERHNNDPKEFTGTDTFIYTPTSDTEGTIGIKNTGNSEEQYRYHWYTIKDNQLYVAYSEKDDGLYRIFTKQK